MTLLLSWITRSRLGSNLTYCGSHQFSAKSTWNDAIIIHCSLSRPSYFLTRSFEASSKYGTVFNLLLRTSFEATLKLGRLGPRVLCKAETQPPTSGILASAVWFQGSPCNKSRYFTLGDNSVEVSPASSPSTSCRIRTCWASTGGSSHPSDVDP